MPSPGTEGPRSGPWPWRGEVPAAAGPSESPLKALLTVPSPSVLLAECHLVALPGAGI